MSQSANAENGTGADFASCIREYRKKLQTLDGDINVTEIKSLTDDVIHFKQMRYGELQEEQAQLKIRLNQNQTEWEKLSKKINKLKRKKADLSIWCRTSCGVCTGRICGHWKRNPAWSALRNAGN